jgi:hypothetical protein
MRLHDPDADLVAVLRDASHDGAIASPMPDEPPVMRTVLLEMSI